MSGGNAAESAGAEVRNGLAETGAAAGDSLADVREYSFLLNHGVSRATLARACALAARSGTRPHEVLIANGWVGETGYYRALAERWGAAFVEPDESWTLAPEKPDKSPRECLQSGLLRQRREGRGGLVLTPDHARPGEVGRMLAKRAADERPAAIAPPAALRETVLRSFGRHILYSAIHGLEHRYADESAGGGLSKGQRRGLAAFAAVTAVSGTLFPLETLRACAGIATLFFALVVCLRLVACLNLAFLLPLRLLRRESPRPPDAELPVYTVLVPLFHEANMVRGLVRALARMDYPVFRRCYTKL